MPRITDKMIAEYFDTPHRTVQGWKVNRPKVYAALRYAYGRSDQPEEVDEMMPEQLCKHLDDLLDDLVDDLVYTLAQIDNAKDQICDIVENTNPA